MKFLKTGTSCVSSTLPPISQFFAVCILFSVFMIFTFCPITIIPPVVLPSFYIYVNSVRIAPLQCSACSSLSEDFILIYSWVGWISLSSNSLKKGSWVLYSFFFFFILSPFFFFIRTTTWLDIILPPFFLLLQMLFFYNVFWHWVFLRRTLRSTDFFFPFL